MRIETRNSLQDYLTSLNLRSVRVRTQTQMRLNNASNMTHIDVASYRVYERCHIWINLSTTFNSQYTFGWKHLKKLFWLSAIFVCWSVGTPVMFLLMSLLFTWNEFRKCFVCIRWVKQINTSINFIKNIRVIKINLNYHIEILRYILHIK